MIRLSHKVALHICADHQEVVVYNKHLGTMHLLEGIAYTLIRACQQQSATPEAIATQCMAEFEIESEVDLPAAIANTSRELIACGILVTAD